LIKRASAWLLVVAFCAAAILCASAQNVQHLSVPQPGGMPGLPVMTGILPATNGIMVTWDGPSGYYQLFEKKSLKDQAWQAVGKATNLIRTATVSISNANAFFRVSGPSPHYAGLPDCIECHASIVNTEIHTLHAGAFSNACFVAEGGQTNISDLPSHTVGYGLPTGFVDAAKTPNLAGVQCENCHGPAANHAANPGDPTVVPRVELAATVCGGCHTGPYHPTFDEWKTSDHANIVVEDSNATEQIDSCGRCHSGSARLSLLLGQSLPVGDANVPIVCSTCHDPHQTNAYPAQLRYPLSSTNDYFMQTNGTFASQYNPAINVCAQCHNDLGASWTNSLSAPHHSPQYNILLGTVGELTSGLAHYQPGSHALLITNQCIDCHMQTAPYQSPTQPALTGHSFRVQTYSLCFNCHPSPEPLVQFTMGAVSNRIQEVKSDLDFWAASEAPPSLWARYGNRAWEYTTPGELSPGGPGPTASEQALIPVNIQKARFNLYLVLDDGSFGVHNGPYLTSLLDAAETWIEDELDP
jgi:hypothetical protein